MNALLKITSDSLEEKERAFCQALMTGMSIGDASVQAGYSHRTSGYEVLRRPRVEKALREFRQRVINSEGATLALKTMIELLGPKTPAGTRYNAAKTILALAGHRVDGPDNKGEKDLHEMDEVQLRAFIARAQKTIEEGAEPPVIKLVDHSAHNEAQA